MAGDLKPKRIRIQLRGIVQGVGFRPFVYHLAQELGLSGYVRNSSAGLVIEVEGRTEQVDGFAARLSREAPPLAQIEETEAADLAAHGDLGFVIRESLAEEGEFVLVSPDVATCADCLQDMRDPANRRYEYPFTNCTNCGPRYSIIQDIPYDRPKTTMARFQMCAACRAEYDDPENRRFHAQPNACPVCGPRLSADVAEARRLLREGKILAIKGLGGFHLACDPANDEAVRRLRARKRRGDKPFALMARDLAAVERICLVSETDRHTLTSDQRPIVVMARREDCGLSPVLAPNDRTLGVMLPYTPLHHLLFDDPGLPVLVMTSGNLSEEPIVTANAEARERLAGVADWFLDHDRDIFMRLDDSVVRTFEGRARLLRRSRGYAPQPIDLGREVAEILACGGELKNTFCLTKGRYAVLSQHIGDLENYETLVFFEETLANLKKVFRVEPRAVAYDLHPQYLSTRLALEIPDLSKVAVQHHHAHVASCMAENRLSGKVIGVAFDGTGYGTDGQIWGGEFLTTDYAGFERRAHFRYVPLPGGDAAVRQTWRPALSYLTDTFGAAGLPQDLALWRQVPESQTGFVRKMLARGVGTVQTSSCGRLFDAVASITGLRQEVNFEAQAAIELETAAGDEEAAAYPFEITETEPWQIDMRPAIGAIVGDLRRGYGPGKISASFHNTVATVIVEVCRRLRAQEGLERVCLSGGTFQNMRLLRLATDGLRAKGFEVFLHAQVPANDGGIALGQAVVAAALLGE